jgi:hypothetical protein
MKTRKVLAVAAAILVLGFASNAAARHRRGDAVEREGFLIGFALGGGALSCKDCASKAGPVVDFQVGLMVNDRLAIMLDGMGMAVAESDNDFGDVTTTNGLATIAAQYWVADRFWLKGGIGAGTTRATSEGHELASDSGLAVMGAAGYELLQKGKLALDLQARFGSTKHQGGRISQLTASIGFNWH